MSIDTDYYIYAEPFIVSLYLIFIFFSIQIWLLWKDIDKNKLKIKSFFTDSFFKKNCIYVYSFSVFFIVHGFLDKTTTPVVYINALGILTLISLVVFAYDWYSMLRTCVSKKSLPQELIDLRCVLKRT